MILIKNARYLIKSADKVLENVDLLIDGNRIAKIGYDLSGLCHSKAIDATGKIVCPGFVNMHTHLYQNMLKGVREDLLLKPWCEEVTFPFSGVIRKYAHESKNFDLAYYYGMLGAIEQIHCGITTFVDMDIIYDALFDSWRDLGVRAVGAIQAVNRWVPKALMVDDEVRKRDIQKTIDRWHDNGILKVAIAPSTPFACTPEFLNWLKDLSVERGLNLFSHVSENLWEVEQSRRDCGMTPLEYLESIGFLSVPMCAVHGVHFTPAEIELAKRRGVSVCYNPKSNSKLASGIAPIVEYLQNGIPVVLATDGAASNDLLDMFEDMRTGLMLQKLKYMDPACMGAREIFRMATQSGAELLGLDAGVLEEGKLADIILLDTEKAHFGPVHDVIQNLVYCGKENDVVASIINGRIVMEDGVIVSVDEKTAVANATELACLRCREAYEKLSAEF
ncbi:MAG: amidohydrolase [Bacillota bacterium]